MKETKVGYEIDKMLVDPIEYWVHHIEGGRRTKKIGPFATEENALLAVDRDKEWGHGKSSGQG